MSVTLQEAIDLLTDMPEGELPMVITYIKDLRTARDAADSSAPGAGLSSDEFVDKLIADMPDDFEIEPEALAAFKRLNAMIKPIAVTGFDPDKERYDALVDKYGPVA